MKVIPDIADKYATVLSVTTVGSRPTGVDVSTFAIDLTKHSLLTLGSDGKWTPGRIEDGQQG